MSVVIVLASSLEDAFPPAVGLLGWMRQQPVDVAARAAHAGPHEEQHVSRCLDEVRFLRARHGRLREQDRVPEASVGAVDEEKIVAGLMRGPLRRGGDIDCDCELVLSSFGTILRGLRYDLWGGAYWIC